jgi:glutaryl-CoA dehydrogenase
MFRPAIRQCTRPLATSLKQTCKASRTYASASSVKFDWQDPLDSKSLLTEEELAIAETAERYCQERMLPRVLRKQAMRTHNMMLT